MRGGFRSIDAITFAQGAGDRSQRSTGQLGLHFLGMILPQNEATRHSFRTEAHSRPAQVDITARVAHRLLGFEGLPFEDAFDMRGKAAQALGERSYENNQLLPLGREFRAPLETVAGAVALYFHGNGYRDKALDYLRRTVERLDDGTARWPTSQRHYGGCRGRAVGAG